VNLETLEKAHGWLNVVVAVLFLWIVLKRGVS
jgi:hypothetical protein